MTVPAATALILAGDRREESATALLDKAFLPVNGVPMLLRVVQALQESGCVSQILIANADHARLRALPGFASQIEQGHIRLVDIAASPAASVKRILDNFSGPWPLYVTTADHALLTSEMIRYFRDNIGDADITAAIVTETDVRAAYPNARRTFLRFRDGAIKGTNLFCLKNPRARPVVDFWQTGERHRKKPWRLIGRIGLKTTFDFASGRLRLEEALHRLGRKMNARLAVVKMPFPDIAFDVDTKDDLAAAEKILRQRAEPRATANPAPFAT